MPECAGCRENVGLAIQWSCTVGVSADMFDYQNHFHATLSDYALLYKQMAILPRIHSPDYATCEIGIDNHMHGKARGPHVTQLFGKYEVIFNVSPAENHHE